MTFAHKIELESVMCLITVTIVSSFFVWQNNQHHSAQLITPIVADSPHNQNEPIPTDIPTEVSITTQSSPDGTKKVMMKTIKNNDSTITYTFTTADSSGENEKEIYKTTVPVSETMSVPFNAWSPDNKYVFIQKNNDALVFTATGKDIIPEQQFFDIEALFTASGKNDRYDITTGWASPTLLIINTKKEDGTKGSSYWFEIPSKAIIQLSSQF